MMLLTTLFFIYSLCLNYFVMTSSPEKPPSPDSPECLNPKPPARQTKCDPYSHFELCPRPSCWNYCSFIWSDKMRRKYNYIPIHNKEDCVERRCCSPSCVCDEGYYRDDITGNCISYDECMNPCGVNQEFVRNSTECQRTCDNWRKVDANCQIKCDQYTGCVCQSGYARVNNNLTGDCVKVTEVENECPVKCHKPHEKWSPCNSHCQKTCSNYDGPIPCPRICKPGCICEDDYARDQNGDCVKTNKCPPKCPKKEVWSPCNAHCQDTCENYETPNRICTRQCQPGCVCEPGLARTKDGECVPKDKCPPKCTKPNEIWSPCSAHCQDTCDNYENPNRVCTLQCQPGCICDKDYVRHKDGDCVKRTQCPKKCPVYEHWEKCPGICPRDSCAGDNPDYECPQLPAIPLPCQADCVCNKGYKRNPEGKCVPEDECPCDQTCGVNEMYFKSKQVCPQRTCFSIVARYNCKADQNRTSGCDCLPGHLRNKYGQCIRSEQCPELQITCPANETYTPCSNGCLNEGCPVPNSGPPPVCSPPAECYPGCRCANGYYRKENGKCVLKKDCGVIDCGKHGHYSSCINPCPKGAACFAPCIEGCICEKGYHNTGGYGKCIKDKEECGVNEVYTTCGTWCPLTCENRFKPPAACILSCKEGCECDRDYMRHANGTCVPVNQCSNPECPENEHYEKCGSACPATCSNYGRPGPACAQRCVEGCFCDKGYILDGQKCVKPKDCPKLVCGLNEVKSDCAIECPPQTCASMYTDYACLPYECKPGCNCINGYLRNSSNLCILSDQCFSDQTKCPTNETYVPCANGCLQESCPVPNSGPPIMCSSPAQCIPGCRCANGYYRNQTGNCVLKKDCNVVDCGKHGYYSTCINPCPEGAQCFAPCLDGCLCKHGYHNTERFGKCVKDEQQCGANEIYNTCGTMCPITCENRYLPPAPCIASCKEGCECENGYMRHENGTCVPESQCSKPECPENAHYEKCGTACPANCDNYGRPGQICHKKCIEGCFCDDGYILDGLHCVRPRNCPKPICGLNEVKSNCSISFPPQTCASIYTLYQCQPQQCKPGCDCRKGYLRDPNDLCILSDQCPPASPCSPNEEYSKCGADDQPTCETTDEECNDETDDSNESNDNDDSNCVPGCVCLPGLVRDAAGNCIPIDKCGTCPKNEQWVGCEAGYCEPKYCTDLGYPIGCPGIVGPCKGGCVCNNGSVRNIFGICIPIEKCPSCGGDNNATTGCSNYCGNTCEDLNNPGPVACAAYCLYNGCACKPGYVYDGSIKKCILPKDCPGNKPGTSCKDPNAEHVSCATHCPPTCAKPIPDPCPYSACTKNGCNCKRGYILSKISGKCIKISECPSDLGCNGDKNATIKELPTVCPPTCERPEPKICPAIGIEVGCECKPGYIKSQKLGRCILPQDCGGDQPCGVNATFVYCNVDCQDDWCPVDDNRGIIACDPPYPCPSGCHCKINYRRNKQNNCILASECPKVNCTRDNEEWHSCPSPCLKERCEDVNAPPETCNTLLLNCQPQCICKKGFYRDRFDRCIPAHECPHCGPNERYLVDTNECKKTCFNVRLTAPPSLCKPSTGCFCNDGYVRLYKDGSGPCVPVDKCVERK